MVNPAVQDLGKQPYLPAVLCLPPSQDSQEKQDIAEQSPIKMGLTYCTIQSPHSLSLSPLCLGLSLPFSPLSALCLCPQPTGPGGRISAVSQVPALALWEGRALVNGDVGGVVGAVEEVKGRAVGVCVSLVNRALWDVTV